ncbi:MAG TPA: ferritin [Roseiflexaceae bacterium]|nr:ferritin [Roseiflexaceae bacterium]HMP40487.1 ferritin [Roseiflexaceae bacterium]
MLSDTMQQALNKQMNFEFAASHAYMAIAAFFEDRNLEGFAHWFRIQSEEEREHALRFFDYLNDRRGRALVSAVPEPDAEFGSPLDAMEHALAHEQRVTAAINEIYALAIREGDYATQSMLKWFVDEQVEEEKSADAIIQHLKLIGNDGAGLLYLDRELAGRQGEEAGGEAAE